jgi:hypothetical protein
MADSPPSPQATYERARRLANQAVWTISLQRRRLLTGEPEDREFMFRKLADYQFLIFALIRLRRTAELAGRVLFVADAMKSALVKFDDALPHLRAMRNVIEHIDDYSLDQGRDRKVSRRSLEVGVYNDTVIHWLGHELNADVAVQAAQALFKEMQAAQSLFPNSPCA